MPIPPAAAAVSDDLFRDNPAERGRRVYDAASMPEPPSSLPRDAIDHLDALYRLALHLTRKGEDAEDLVQETYTRASAAAGRFERGSNVRAWLFRILRNAYIDGYRRSRVAPVHGGLDVDEAADPGRAEPLRGDAELECLRSVVADDIQTALAALSDDARTIVLLDLEGLTETEIGSVIGCPVGTVKSRLSRARAALRERLRDYAR